MTLGAPMGEVVEAIQDDIEIVLCEKVSKHRNQPDAEEGRVWRIFKVHLQTLFSAIETSVFCCILFATTWLWLRCAEADLLVQSQTGFAHEV